MTPAPPRSAGLRRTGAGRGRIRGLGMVGVRLTARECERISANARA